MFSLDKLITFVFKVSSYDLLSLKTPKVEIDLKNDLYLDLDRKYRVVAHFEGLGKCYANMYLCSRFDVNWRHCGIKCLFITKLQFFLHERCKNNMFIVGFESQCFEGMYTEESSQFSAEFDFPL